MSFSLRHPGRSACWLVLAIALLLQAHAVSAGSVSSTPFDARAHAEICKCGARCRQESCCCGRVTRARGERREASPIEMPVHSTASSAPCLDQGPCGGSGIPPVSGSRLHEKDNALAPDVSRNAMVMSGFLPMLMSCGRPRRRPSRIQRPPPTEPACLIDLTL